MHAIVTGGAGFIGSHLVRRLLDEGWTVTVVDNLSSGYRHNVPEGARFIWGDLTQEDTLSMLPKDGCDVVFHLASHVGQELSFDHPVLDLKANALSTMLLLKWCQDRGVRRVVFASSMNVYGNAPTEQVAEDAPLRPPSPYAVGKLASEQLLQIYQNFGMHTTSLRLFNVYGPGQDMSNMMQGMVSIYMAYVARGEPVYVRGSQQRFRDFVYVTDVVDAFFRCCDEKASGRIYNIATGRKTFVSDLLKATIRAFGHDPDTYQIIAGPPTRQDQFGLYGDATRIRQELGWEPKIPLETGLERMARWVKETNAVKTSGKVVS